MQVDAVRKGLLLATTTFGVVLAGSARAQSGGKLIYQTGKTVTQNADGTVVLTASGFTGALKSDAAADLAYEAQRQFLSAHPTVPTNAQTWVYLIDGTLTATTKAWAAGTSGYMVLDAAGPPPPQPPPPPSGTILNSIGRVQYHQDTNGYSRDTSYGRTVDPDPHGDGYIDGSWNLITDHVSKDGGGGHHPCGNPPGQPPCPDPS